METTSNMQLYEQLRKVPKEAIKPIAAGRLKGMSDINPVWRIKAMTEAFGPCGIGWKYEITKQWQEQYGNEVKAFTNVNLYIKAGGAWSEPIPGTGGATLVELNSKGSYVNDEGFKMSLTDALSVAMKALGVAADVYFSSDATKYYRQPDEQPSRATESPNDLFIGYAKPAIEQARSKEELARIFNEFPTLQSDKDFISALTAQRKKLGIMKSGEV